MLSKWPIGILDVTPCEYQVTRRWNETLNLHRNLFFGTIVLISLLQITLGYTTVTLESTTAPHPVIPPGFVAVVGPHDITVLVGPLQASPTGGYEREVMIPGQPPFIVSTEPGVTPQEIANIYG